MGNKNKSGISGGNGLVEGHCESGPVYEPLEIREFDMNNPDEDPLNDFLKDKEAMIRGCGDSGLNSSYSFGGFQSNHKLSRVGSNVRDDRDKNCEELGMGVAGGDGVIGGGFMVGQPKSFTIQNPKKNDCQPENANSQSPGPKIFSQSFNYGLPYEMPTTAQNLGRSFVNKRKNKPLKIETIEQAFFKSSNDLFGSKNDIGKSPFNVLTVNSEDHKFQTSYESKVDPETKPGSDKNLPKGGSIFVAKRENYILIRFLIESGIGLPANEKKHYWVDCKEANPGMGLNN
jgi:hypothetical protein